MQRRKGKDFTFSLIDLFPEKYSLESEDSQDNTDGSETVLLLPAPQTQRQAKAEMLRRLADGPVPCSMSVDAGTIVVKDEKGRKAGRLVNGQHFRRSSLPSLSCREKPDASKRLVKPETWRKSL